SARRSTASAAATRWPPPRKPVPEILLGPLVRHAGEHECSVWVEVHHAYLAQVGFRAGDGVRSAVWQAVCSPFRNPLDTREQRTLLAGGTRAAGAVARALARAAKVPDPEVGWRLAHERPWFDNQVAMLELEGRRARFVLEKATPDESSGDGVRMEIVFSR